MYFIVFKCSRQDHDSIRRNWGKGYSSSSSKSCRPKSLLQGTSIRLFCRVLVRGVRAREFQIFLSSNISLFNVSVMSLDLRECHSYFSLILCKKLENQRSNVNSVTDEKLNSRFALEHRSRVEIRMHGFELAWSQ